MLKTYRNKLEALPSKPTLFASYSDHQGEYGHQGGTLPDQIFMHWYGKNSLKDIRNEEIDWFFSHEVAHLFQGNVSRTEKTKHHWIHEGAAEYMAYLSLQKGTTTQSNYAKQHLNKNINSCLKDVSTNTVNAYIDMGYYPILYHCGLLLWQAIDHESKLRTQNSNVFTIWHEYRKLSERDGPGLDTLTKVIKPLVSEKTMFATFNLLTITHDELESIRVVTK